MFVDTLTAETWAIMKGYPAVRTPAPLCLIKTMQTDGHGPVGSLDYVDFVDDVSLQCNL